MTRAASATEMSGDELLALAEDVLRRARSRGADAAEAYLCSTRGTVVEHQGPLGAARDLGGAGVAVRLAEGKRGGGARVAGLTGECLDRAVDEALARARSKPATLPRLPLSAGGPSGASFPLDPALASPEPDELMDVASEVTGALAEESELTYHAVSLATRSFTFAVASTAGAAAWDRDAVQNLTLEVRLTRGAVSRTARDQLAAGRPLASETDLAAFTRAAVGRARAAFDARPLARPVDEVVLDPVPAGQLVSFFLRGASGGLVGRGQGPLAGRTGHEVASKHLTIEDLPRGRAGPRNQRIDDEGTPTRDRALVERGVLTTPLLDSASAATLRAEPTGHHFRGIAGRWASSLRVRPGNLHVAPGSASRDDLVASMDRGVVLSDQLLGLFVASPVTGDISVLCGLAFYVEGGEVLHALPPTACGGNVYRILNNVRGVSNETQGLLSGRFPALATSGIACAT